MTRPSILICTLGTSLFRPNLEGLPKPDAFATWAERVRKAGEPEPPPLEIVSALREAYQSKDPRSIADALLHLSPTSRLCGAEINSIASMIDKEYVPGDCGLFLLHSDTDDGRSIAAILKTYYKGRGHAPVETIEVPDLQDQDPKRFRTKGLRNLARKICGVIREHFTGACAINATGGYKAQIAIGVLLDQAIGVPVYYKHELFSEIIVFPPMPVALDFEVWMRASGLLFDLERTELVSAAVYEEDWDEKYESLIERESIGGEDYLALSPTGQIFHETFRQRFRTAQDQILPPPVPSAQKRPPRLEKGAGWPGEHPEVERLMSRVTNEVPQVVHCATFYYNPDLPERTHFRVGRDGIVGVYSDGNYTVKFRVETTAQTTGQQAAVVASLNEWLNR